MSHSAKTYYINGDGTYDSRHPLGNKPVATTDRTQLAYYFNSEAATVGAAAPSFWWANGASISSDRAFAGTKSIKVPIVSGSESAGGGAYLSEYIGQSPVKGDTTWFSLRIWAPLNATWVGTPGFIKWFRYRMGEAGTWLENRGAIYTALAADGKLLSNFEGFPDDFNYEETVAGSGPTLGSWTTMEHCVVHDNVSVDDGGAGEQRFYRNGVQLWRRTNQKTLQNSTDQVQALAFIDFWNGGASFSGNMYIDDMTIAIKGSGRDDTAYMATDANGRKFIGI